MRQDYFPTQNMDSLQARIYKPSKTAMQSGKANCKAWILEFCPSNKQFTDPIMGWCGSKETLPQVRLTFRSLDAAKTYATKLNLNVQIESPHSRKVTPRLYADNFKYDKVG